MVTLLELYERARALLASALEASELFAHVTGRTVHQLHDLGDEPVTAETAQRLDELLLKRKSGFPLQYLLGEWEFYSLPFQVGEGVLIPRQDTETLVDEALKLARAMDKPEILDLCSGCGCIAVTLAHHLPDAGVTALEFSAKAFPYLERNIELNNVVVHPVLSDLREYAHPRPIHILVSNPPYIPRRELAGLQEEVCHEPLLALDGGDDGLHYYRAIARRYRDQLAENGHVLLEVGAGQADAVCGILEEYKYRDVARVQDLNGIDRVITAVRPAK